MELGLFAESAALADLDETLRRAAALGITRIELSTGGQCANPFLDADRLPADDGARRELLHQLDRHGLRLSALNVSAFPPHPAVGEAHTELTRQTMRPAGLLGVERASSGRLRSCGRPRSRHRDRPSPPAGTLRRVGRFSSPA